LEALLKAEQMLREESKFVKDGEWTGKEIEYLN